MTRDRCPRCAAPLLMYIWHAHGVNAKPTVRTECERCDFTNETTEDAESAETR